MLRAVSAKRRLSNNAHAGAEGGTLEAGDGVGAIGGGGALPMPDTPPTEAGWDIVPTLNENTIFN